MITSEAVKERIKIPLDERTQPVPPEEAPTRLFVA